MLHLIILLLIFWPLGSYLTTIALIYLVPKPLSQTQLSLLCLLGTFWPFSIFYVFLVGPAIVALKGYKNV